jgi:hypothetical protein
MDGNKNRQRLPLPQFNASMGRLRGKGVFFMKTAQYSVYKACEQYAACSS